MAQPTHDPLWQQIPLPYERPLGALGFELRLATNSPELAALAEASFGRFARREDGRIDFDFEVVVGPAGGPAGDGRPTEQFHRERGYLYCAGDGRSVVVADLAAGHATAFLAASSAPEVVRGVLLESPVWRFAAYRGLVALHAATVVIDRVSFVLRGPAGAGKSTLAYAALRAGHTLVAEEVTWYDPTGAQPALRGAPWRLHLESDAARIWPQLTPGPSAGAATTGTSTIGVSTAGAKLVIDVDREPNARWSELAPPGPLVFVGHNAEPTHLAPLTPDAARTRFAATALVGEHTQRPERLEAARDALIAHGAFALGIDRPDEGIAALEGLARRLEHC